MKGLWYLLLTGYKNALLSLLKNPAKLVFILFLVALMALVFVGGAFGGVEASHDIQELFAMAFVLYTMGFVSAAKHGFQTGASFYSMADVNVLFSVPLSPKRILLYGLLKQVVSSLLIGFFLLFQYAWLHNLYGITPPFLFAIFFSYCGVVFTGQVTAMAIYAFSSGNEKRKAAVKAVFYGALLLMAGYLIFSFLPQGLSVASLVAVVSDPVLLFFPVSGWCTAATMGIYYGAWPLIAAGLGGLAVFFVVLVLGLLLMRADYYEDVLLATELNYRAVSGSKEGRIPEIGVTNVKVGKTGLGKGWGASAFYFKHRLENRRSRVFLLDRMTWLWVAATIVFGFFMRHMGILPVFFFSVYLGVFSVAMGRWARELTVHYVYLLPEKAFQKLLMIQGEQFYKILMEALVVFIPVGFIVGAPLWVSFGAVFARFGFGLIFLAANGLMERLFGGIQSKLLSIPLYFILLLAVSAPGIAGSLLLSRFFPEALGLLPVFLIVGLWNILVSGFLLFLSRNILDTAELNFR